MLQKQFLMILQLKLNFIRVMKEFSQILKVLLF